MGAQEQHHRSAVAGESLDLGQGAQPLPGEPFGQQGQEVRHRGAAGELVTGGVQEPLDGFHAEHHGEFAPQPGGGGVQREPLVDGQVAAQTGGEVGWARS